MEDDEADSFLRAVAHAPPVSQGPPPGAVLQDRFEIVRELGRGGMGRVYLGRDLMLGRQVAIKLMNQRAPAAGVEQLEREARATARLQHPHIVTLYEIGRFAGRPFLVLELLEGETLAERWERGRQPRADLLDCFLELADALARAHASGVVHRDLKPRNVWVLPGGSLKILDFGLASVSEQQGRAVGGGTPAYMAPEQWTSGAEDGRTDVWAFGVMLHEGLTGCRPFDAASGNLDDLRAQVTGADAAPRVSARVEVEPTLDDLVARCLEKERARRPTASEVAAALGELRHGAVRARSTQPYRYLDAFGPGDAEWFFGRDAEIASLVGLLDRCARVWLVGPSGAGKSSLVRAGLGPRLARESGPWEIVTLRPGRRPFEALEQALRRLGAFECAGAADLRARPGQLGRIARAHAEATSARVLLSIDQGEELFALCDDAREREAFLAALTSAADELTGPTRVIASLREDFLAPWLSSVPDGARGSEVMVLGAPGESALAEAVLRPARIMGYEVEPALVESVVDPLRGERAPLPLLQFAMSHLWESRDRAGRRLTARALLDLGGVSGLLAQHAEQLLRGATRRTSRPRAPWCSRS